MNERASWACKKCCGLYCRILHCATQGEASMPLKCTSLHQAIIPSVQGEHHQQRACVPYRRSCIHSTGNGLFGRTKTSPSTDAQAITKRIFDDFTCLKYPSSPSRIFICSDLDPRSRTCSRTFRNVVVAQWHICTRSLVQDSQSSGRVLKYSSTIVGDIL